MEFQASEKTRQFIYLLTTPEQKSAKEIAFKQPPTFVQDNITETAITSVMTQGDMTVALSHKQQESNRQYAKGEIQLIFIYFNNFFDKPLTAL